MATRPTRPAGGAPSAGARSGSSAVRARVTPTTVAPIGSTSAKNPTAAPSPAAAAPAARISSEAQPTSPVATFLPSPSSASDSIPRRSAESSSSSSSSAAAAAALKHSDHDDDSDNEDAGGEGMGRRADLKQVMMKAKAEAAQAAKEAASNPNASATSDAADPSDVEAAKPIQRQLPVPLDSSGDVSGPPLLPPQLDEDNDLYYCPRLTRENLERITGEQRLERVGKLSLHLNTEEQDLAELSTLLPSLRELSLIPPSFVSSFRDFGRSLTAIQRLSLPQTGLSDLDGIEMLTQLREFRAPSNSIEDLSPLMFATTLEVLDLSENKIAELDMIEFIGVCTSMRELYLDGNPISLRTHYRTIVISRCPDLPPRFTLDGVEATDAERERLEEGKEQQVDRRRKQEWTERQEAKGKKGAKEALQRKIATAEYNTLSTAPRPDRTTYASSSSSSAAPHVTSAITSTSTAVPISRASVPSSSTSLSDSAARKREYQRFLDEKEAQRFGGGGGAGEEEDPRKREERRKKQQKESAVSDIMRLENEMREDQASGVAKEYTDRARASNQKQAAAPIGSTAVPRLQFDAAFQANLSPSPSPLSGSAPFPHNERTGSGHFGGAANTAQHNTAHMSLSTPRPGSASGNRPGTAGAGGRPGTSGGAPESASESASDLTYGSDAILAGGFAQAIRARKKQNSISMSISGGHGSVHSNDDDGSRSPSSTRPSSSSRGPTGGGSQIRPQSGSRSASRERNLSETLAAQQHFPQPTNTNNHSQPVIIFKAKFSSAAGAVNGASSGASSPPILPSHTSSPAQPVSRPLVVSGGSASSMLQRHMAGAPVGSPVAAARAHQQAAAPVAAATPVHQQQPAAAAKPGGKVYTLVRGAGSAPKK